MKRLLMLFVAGVFSLTMVLSAQAARTVQVTTLEDFQPNNPPQVLHIQMNGNVRLDYDTMLFQGFHVTGRILGKSGDGFVFVPVSYINYQEEQIPMKKEFPAVIRTRANVVRQNQPFTLVFPHEETQGFQYYVPSNSDMN